MIGSYFQNNAVTVDTQNMRLILNLSAMNIMMADDETTSFIKTHAGSVYVPLKKIDNTICFSLNVMQQFFHTSYNISGSSIRLKASDETVSSAKVGSTPITAVSSLFAETKNTVTLPAGEQIFIEEETANYYKISDFDGNIYYYRKERHHNGKCNACQCRFLCTAQDKVQAAGQ